MARISRTDLYIYDGTVSDNDFVIGSDGDLMSKTKSYRMKDLRDYLLAGLSPETGGTLKYSEYIYNGVETSPSAVFNALNPVFVVMPYNVVILSMKGDKYLLKLQDVTVGFTETPIADSDFILLRGDVSLGDGLDVLKGYNVASKKHEFYSLKSTSLNLSKETSSSVETGNILIEMKTDINLSIGVGSENVYKGYNSSNSKHEFRGVKDSLSIDVSSNATDLSLEVKEIAQNVGVGVPVYTSFDTLTKKHKFRSLKSDTLNVTGVGEDLLLEIPNLEANTIYVNNKYTGGSSNGSKTKPYTTVAAAVTGYIGTGTRLAPEKAGYILYVERGNGTYNETNLNLTIRNLIFYLEEETSLNVTNRSNWIIDFDASEGASFTASHEIKLFIYGNLFVYGNGFRNSGTTSTTPYVNTALITIKGNGNIGHYLPADDKLADPTLLRYTLISAGKTNPLNVNGNFYTFVFEDITFYCETQRILELGGQVVEFRNTNIVSSYDNVVVLLDYKSILVTGGTFRFYDGSIGADGTLKRNGFIYVEGVQTPSVDIVGAKISGKFVSFINYSHTSSVFDYTNKISMNSVYSSFLNADAVFKNLTTVENTFAINECNLPGFPLLKHASSTANIKIYTSASNKIGAYIIDSLPEYGTYALALAAPLPVGARFVNTNSNNADKNTWKIQTI
jgi:hypothetical protein